MLYTGIDESTSDEERESESDAGSERESVHEQGNENMYDLCMAVPG